MHTRATVPTAGISVPLYRHRRAGTQEAGTSDPMDSSRTGAQNRFVHVGTRRNPSDSAGWPRVHQCAEGDMPFDEYSAQTLAAVQKLSDLSCANAAARRLVSSFAGSGTRRGRTLRTHRAPAGGPSVAIDRSARVRCRGARGHTAPGGQPAPGPDAGVGHPRHTNGTPAVPTAGCSACGSQFDRSDGGL